MQRRLPPETGGFSHQRELPSFLIRCALSALMLAAFALTSRAEMEEITSTTITITRAEVDQMAALWETDAVAISPLATAQYPQFSGAWQYIFPNNGISGDGDIHVNMAVNAGGSGRYGNNLGTSSPIVAEVINATNGQLNYLSANSRSADFAARHFPFFHRARRRAAS